MTAPVLWLIVSVLVAHPASRIPHPGVRQVSVRFHHVHYRVGDPAAAMDHAAREVGGARVVVPGLGVGVRAGAEYLLFDRLDSTDAAELEQVPIAEGYRAAVAWLGRHGVTAAPPAPAALRASATLLDERYDHVAFVTTDLSLLTEVVTARGSTPLRSTEDAVLFEAGGGLRVELVRETGRPDAFWCPMHLDVRSAHAGTCHLCGMDLVTIPAPKLGEYNLDVTQIPGRAGHGLSGLTLTVRDPESDAVVQDFVTLHDRVFHLFIVGRDLEYFEHVHPEPAADGSFLLTHAVLPGEYMLIADFLPVAGTTQMVQRALLVAGTPRPGPPAAASADVRITLQQEDFVAGKYACLTFRVSDVRTGQPVTDLEPYLGAPAHLLLVRGDLTDAVHSHPEEITTGGPVISFHPLVPAPGDYKLWVQIQRAGGVITVPFSLRAER